MPPGGSPDYRYEIPRDHPAGTFWYHSHRHGSTAIDVVSGMKGGLVVIPYRGTFGEWCESALASAGECWRVLASAGAAAR